jgi:threonyl-tRNA synthetase
MKDNAQLEKIRHSTAHLLAAATLELYPGTKLTIGPAIENGFYYDFEFQHPISDEDLPKLEKKMEEILPSWQGFSHREISAEEAKEFYKNNRYKTELIEEIVEKGEKMTFYKSGEFEDLCRGGHSENPAKEIGAFKLLSIAGAYWRGDEKNQMLTRIYGTAFPTQKELDEHLALLEEAKKRDHRKIAKEQDLLIFSDLVGSGMPLYTPKGNLIRNAIIAYSRELNTKLGFGEVHTPNINKGELFKISGHYDQYKADMLSVHSQYVTDEMFLKPMNCPQHTQIYASRARSYRDLPIRYADFANLYRDERPGELSGLTRLRAFAQDDGHIFCREDQIEEEISNVLSAVQEALATYKIEYWMRLSLRDPNNTEKYLGDEQVWEKSQNLMRSLLQKKEIPFKEAIGEAAFYGPKIDIMAVDALQREWQISTVQLDFNQPSRFKLIYTDSDGSEKTPVMIHRALIGSPDRFLGVLIEHYAGAFPTWLSPVQAIIIPISDKQLDYAQKLYKVLREQNIRVEVDDKKEPVGGKIRRATLQKVPYLCIIGEKEKQQAAESGMDVVSLRLRDGSDGGTITIQDLIAKVQTDIEKKL